MPTKKPQFPEIDAIYQKYGHVPFRMGLQHMIETGSNHFDDENIESTKEACHKEEADIKTKGGIPIMTAAYKISIILCAQELSKIETWDLLAFVKKVLRIGY
ncbi:MAG: hypothetical protein FWC82_04210 [Firmicutes bacterium]|nr:hypothetical protein [Bacillota bacterium]